MNLKKRPNSELKQQKLLSNIIAEPSQRKLWWVIFKGVVINASSTTLREFYEILMPQILQKGCFLSASWIESSG